MQSDHVWGDHFQHAYDFEAKNYDNIYLLSSIPTEEVEMIMRARETLGSNDLFLVFNRNGENFSSEGTIFLPNEFENYAMPEMLIKNASLLTQFKNMSNIYFIGKREKYFSIYDMYNVAIRVSPRIKYYFWDEYNLTRYNICLPPYISLADISNYTKIDLEALRNNILLHILFYREISLSEYKTQNIPIIRKDRDFIYNVDSIPILYTIFNREVFLAKTGESEQYDLKNFKEYRNLIFDIIVNDVNLMLVEFNCKDLSSLVDIIDKQINSALSK